MRKLFSAFSIVASLAGCRIESLGPQGVTVTQPIYVNERDVQVFQKFEDVRGTYTVIDAIWVDDDGIASSDSLVRSLRVMAGGRGANAIVLDRLNRTDSGSRTVLGFSLDDSPTARATAIWIGEGPPPERKLR